ncbi:MAG: IclR helix-turn-helix domain protein [Candidatus Bathyarchaeota archaeon BA2]|nr:MAG: IclR helix-turn-helix domain protein [Candidatus Bathyarchaeota archaeon BA2]
MVRRSKLERYISILEILARARNFASQEPMDLTQLMRKTGLSKSVLKQHLDSLIQQNLVEEQNLGKDKIFYAITERGLKVLYVVVPIIEEARKIPASLYQHE